MASNIPLIVTVSLHPSDDDILAFLPSSSQPSLASPSFPSTPDLQVAHLRSPRDPAFLSPFSNSKPRRGAGGLEVPQRSYSPAISNVGSSSSTLALPSPTLSAASGSSNMPFAPPTSLALRENHSLASDEEDADLGPFEFKPYVLASMLDPKDLDSLCAIGGTEGLLKGLRTSSTKGLGQGHDRQGEGWEGGNGAYGADIEERRRVYGPNVLPHRVRRTLPQLMWLALKDKVLVSVLTSTLHTPKTVR